MCFCLFIGELSVVVFVLGVIVTLLVVVLLMVVELELVGAVDNKAGHYSVSPGRQQQAAAGLGRWAEREREATHVAVPGGADPTNGTNSDRTAPTSEGTNAAAACVPVPVPSTVAGRGSGWADVHSGIHFLLLLFSFFLGKATSALDRANGFSSHIFSCPKTSRGHLGREDQYLGREVMVTRETTCNLLAGENS